MLSTKWRQNFLKNWKRLFYQKFLSILYSNSSHILTLFLKLTSNLTQNLSSNTNLNLLTLKKAYKKARMNISQFCFILISHYFEHFR